MISIRSRFGKVAAGIVLVALVCLVHELDYREIRFEEWNRTETAQIEAPADSMLRDHRDAKFYTPYGETDCRAPRTATEFRVYMEWCPDDKACYRTCSIEPRNPDTARARVKQRVLQKS